MTNSLTNRLMTGSRHRGRRRVAWVWIAMLAAFALACASPSKPHAMKPAPGDRYRAEPAGSVDIEVSGGKETFPMGRSQISNGDLTLALAAALEESGLLYAVVDRPGDYHIDVHIEELRQPHFAWTMRVRLAASWSLWRRGEYEPLWRGVITTSYAEPFPVEFFGIKRLRLANEGAARDNISAAIAEIANHVD